MPPVPLPARGLGFSSTWGTPGNGSGWAPLPQPGTPAETRIALARVMEKATGNWEKEPTWSCPGVFPSGSRCHITRVPREGFGTQPLKPVLRAELGLQSSTGRIPRSCPRGTASRMSRRWRRGWQGPPGSPGGLTLPAAARSHIPALLGEPLGSPEPRGQQSPKSPPRIPHPSPGSLCRSRA